MQKRNTPTFSHSNKKTPLTTHLSPLTTHHPSPITPHHPPLTTHHPVFPYAAVLPRPITAPHNPSSIISPLTSHLSKHPADLGRIPQNPKIMPNEVKFTIRLNVQGQQQVVTATADAKDLKEAIDDVKTAAQNVGANQGWQNMMLGINSAMEVAGRLKSAVDSLATEYQSWETAMAKVNTMAGRDAAGLAQLKEQVTELSKEIPKTKEELADGLYQVISNGVPEADWVTFLEQSAKASAGGIADLGETVKVTSTMIKSYGLEWSKAGEIQDKIQATAKNGVTSFEELASALPRVSGNAATLGVSVDELMASFATLTGFSGNTAEVSTQLAAIFTALVKPSSEATKMAQEMGIQFDAAAIKAAGGMSNFMQQLDASVKQYAQAHGMLEQEIYGKLFGSAESLRALIPLTGELKDKFQQNVKAMASSTGTITETFDTMASTGEARMQMLKNEVRSMLEPLAAVASAAQPVVNGLVTIGQVGLGLNAVSTSVKALRSAHILTTASTVAHSLATRVLGTVSAATGISVTALKVAVRGLMIATGVGAVIAALTFVIEKLANASDEAASSQSNLRNAEEQVDQVTQAATQAQQNAKLEMEQAIATCKNFKGTKQEEWKIVDQLNNKYGETMGYFSSVNQWYNALIANSGNYCRQMVIEARTRALANQIAEQEEKKHNILYDDKGNTKLYSNKRERRGLYLGPDHVPGEIVGTSELDKANAAIADSDAIIAAKTKELRGLVNEAASMTFTVQGSSYRPQNPYANTTSTTPGRSWTGSNTNAPTGPTLTENAKTLKQLTDNVAYYKQAIDNADRADEQNLKTLILKKNAAEEELDAYKKLIEAEQDAAQFKPEATTQGDIAKNIAILQKQLDELAPGTEAYKTVTQQINQWQEKLSTVNKGSIQDIENQIQKITEQLQSENLTLQARVELTTQKDELQKKIDNIASEVNLRMKFNSGEWQKGFADFVDNIKKANKEQQKEQLSKKLQAQKDKLKDIGQLVGNVGQSFSTMGKNLKTPALEAAGILAAAIATIIQGYATASAQSATLGPFAWAAFSLAGLAQVTEVVAQVKNIGKYAQGAIAYGPTLGLFGEYPGAANNPEVVAPLDRLRSLISPDSQSPLRVTFRIQGRTLVGILNKQTRHSVRM